MTNKEIINTAFEKAEKNGWKNCPPTLCISEYEEYSSAEQWAFMFIFSHDFAIAFWGEKRLQTHLYVPEEAGMFGLSVTKSMCAWMFHLQEMVLEKEPLKYIEKFL